MYNLLYTSVRKPNCNDQEIDLILESARKNNKGLDITGVLLYSNTRFLQFLEGSYDQIISLYDKIKEDDRHKNVVMMSLKKSATGERIFPSWQMGAKNADTVEFKEKLSKEENDLFINLISGESQDTAKSLKMIQRVFK